MYLASAVLRSYCSFFVFRILFISGVLMDEICLKALNIQIHLPDSIVIVAKICISKARMTSN